MPETVAVKNIGLRGVIVADTAVSFIDGQEGILIYRGLPDRGVGRKFFFHGNRLPAS